MNLDALNSVNVNKLGKQNKTKAHVKIVWENDVKRMKWTKPLNEWITHFFKKTRTTTNGNIYFENKEFTIMKKE